MAVFADKIKDIFAVTTISQEPNALPWEADTIRPPAFAGSPLVLLLIVNHDGFATVGYHPANQFAAPIFSHLDPIPRLHPVCLHLECVNVVR